MLYKLYYIPCAILCEVGGGEGEWQEFLEKLLGKSQLILAWPTVWPNFVRKICNWNWMGSFSVVAEWVRISMFAKAWLNLKKTYLSGCTLKLIKFSMKTFHWNFKYWVNELKQRTTTVILIWELFPKVFWLTFRRINAVKSH